jgi:hypothetical protein
MTKGRLRLPDIFLMGTDTVVIFDNLRKNEVVSNADLTNGSPGGNAKEAEEKIETIIEKLKVQNPSGDKGQRKDSPDISFGTQRFSIVRICVVPHHQDAFEQAVVKGKGMSCRRCGRGSLPQRFDRRSLSLRSASTGLCGSSILSYMYYIDTGDAKPGVLS